VCADYVVADDLFDAHSYDGGSSFLHLLRHVVGDDTFFQGLASWMQAAQGKEVDTALFEATFQQATDLDLNSLFRDWLHHPGTPRFGCEWSYDEEQGQLRLQVHQRQKGADVPVCYQLPLDVAFQGDFGRRRLRMNLEQRQTEVEVPCQSKPIFVRFNDGGNLPGEWIVTQSPAQWRNQLQHDQDPLGRLQAARILTELAEEAEPPANQKPHRNILPLVRALQDDEFWAVRQQAGEALGLHGGDGPRAALFAALWDADSRVREASAWALGYFLGDAEVFAMLVSRLRSERHPGVSSALLQSIGSLEVEGTEEVLLGMVDSTEVPVEVRSAALLALAVAKPALALPRATNLAQSEQPDLLRVAAIECLGILGWRKKAAADALFALLASPLLNIRFAVLEALNEVKPKYLIPGLVEQLDHLVFPDLQSAARDLLQTALRRD
jgi:aminopeptidase N